MTTSNTSQTASADGLDILRRAMDWLHVPKGTKYHLLMRQGRILCALPEDRQTALKLLAMYQPQRSLARIVAFGVKLSVRFGIHRYFLRSWEMPGASENFESEADPGFPGVLIGSTGHLCERAVAVRKSSEGWEVIKMAFGEAGHHILKQEADLLHALDAVQQPVPEVWGFEIAGEVAALRMPWQEGSAWQAQGLTEILQLLRSWSFPRGFQDLRSLDSFEEWRWIHAELIGCPVSATKVTELAALQVAPSIRHGDLTRPNLRVCPKGKLLVHDWERGTMCGPSGLDLVHYLTQDLLFRTKKSGEEVVKDVRRKLNASEVAIFLKEIGWAGLESELMAVTYALNIGAGYLSQEELLAAVVVTKNLR